MAVDKQNVTKKDFLEATLKEIRRVFDSVAMELRNTGDIESLEKLKKHFNTGKMLRSRLGMALCGNEVGFNGDVIKACAATELIHSATLFHDDVIDGASLRRQQPSLWQDVGSTGAILIGDLFYSSALQLVVESGDIKKTSSFVSKVREVCAMEMAHELVFREKSIDVETCIRIARGKTGPLFAYVAEICGGSEQNRTMAFMEAGYKIGTAYQIADDLLDVLGNEKSIGKTLGTDGKRRKFTLAQDDRFSEEFIRDLVQSLAFEAIEKVMDWPELANRLENYIVSDLLPTWNFQFDQLGHAAVYDTR